ncbi:hypothetical protein Dvina_51640 [Dactylosporangium vinaceum]|uniref:Uncharacterized protein n=1 Tax=Dactylosporangium vinaceum TaxID=53362 RepID=A0ABV5M2I7_9ACTN|nr:hypothetical protein [Dactylosporangium vinaceum]UAB96301.1 hypothetical protein Dvina_51640 [Dactylosporangium vinaceum]
MNDHWWFRLEDVLRLASHADGCAEHRVTRAQVTAFGPDGPALILTGTDDHAVLTSNGVPGWYDRTGTEHTVHARTWRPTADAANPTSRRVLGYLPTRHTSGDQRPLIDMLRAASWLEQHWVALDRNAPPLRFADAVRITDHRTELVPAGARWRPAVVEYPTGLLPLRYPALVADRYTTDQGSAIARFDRDAVTAMIAGFSTVVRAGLMPGELPVLRLDGDVLVLLEETDEGTQVGYVEVDRCHPDRDGLYAVGAYLWRWQVVDARLPLRTQVRLRITPHVARLRRR